MEESDFIPDSNHDGSMVSSIKYHPKTIEMCNKIILYSNPDSPRLV